MTDNNNTPQYSKPSNDLPYQEEIGEKPYYDNGSAPVVQNLIDNNQPQYQNTYNNPAPYYNPNNNQPQYYNPPPVGDAQQVNQAYPGQAPYYTPSNNYNDNNNYTNGINYTYRPQRARPKKGVCDTRKCLMCLSIILIIVFFVDIGLQIGFQFFSPFLFIDDLAILTISIIYIVFIKKGNSFNKCWLGPLTVFVWFVGFGVRGFGMTLFESSVMTGIEFFLTGIRTFDLFFCIPSTCGQR